MASKKKPKVIITPHYLLSGKSKRQYEGTSEVAYIMDDKIYDIDNLKPIDELHEMDFDKARDYIIKMKDKFGTEKLRNKWNIKPYDIYGKMFKEYNIPTDRAKRGNDVKLLKQDEKQDRNVDILNQDNMPRFNIILYGEFEGKELSERLVNIATLFSNKKYKIYLKIEEE